MPSFFQLMQRGFMVKIRVGCSIKSLLCNQLGLSQEYLEERIQTILLDGRPVDDVESAIVKQESTLALSAALPGLVGATLRKGGYYAPLRSHISHSETASSWDQPFSKRASGLMGGISQISLMGNRMISGPGANVQPWMARNSSWTN